MEFHELVKPILEKVSGKLMMESLQYFCKLNRISGTEDEAKAVDYIVAKLGEYGIRADIYRFNSLVGQPKEARVDIIYPTQTTFKAITHPFSLSTPDEGIVSEMVHVGRGSEEDFCSRMIKGKIALIDGNASPDKVWLGQTYGCIGQVYVSNEHVPHEMIVTTVWGTPSLASRDRIPRIPVASVSKQDGEMIKRYLQDGKLVVRLFTKSCTSWKKLRMPVATIEGKEERERFLLIGSHLDSWYVGATDNATGNVSCLEIARILNEEREKLKRTVKIAWWVGHSQGRYSGSTHYVDKEWDSLSRNCIAYINIDSPGSRGTTVYVLESMPETMEFSEEIAKTLTGMPVERLKPGRWGDQSFWGVGVPSIDCYSMAPVGARANVGGSGGGWWWHTPYDTIEFVDTKYLVRDTQVNLAIAFVLATTRIIPYRLSENAQVYVDTLSALREVDVGDVIDIGSLIAKAGELKAKLLLLEELAPKVGDERVSEVNKAIIDLTRKLNPTLFTVSGRYEQDAAVDEPYLPSLSYVIRLCSPDGDNVEFAKVSLVRERNRVSDTLSEAIDRVNLCLNFISK
ncbi:MAG: M28 family peptidase [Nitrososphaeria archaeon]